MSNATEVNGRAVILIGPDLMLSRTPARCPGSFGQLHSGAGRRQRRLPSIRSGGRMLLAAMTRGSVQVGGIKHASLDILGFESLFQAGIAEAQPETSLLLASGPVRQAHGITDTYARLWYSRI
jgi:hypothetical protein